MLIFNIKVSDSAPLFFRLKTPIQDFTASAPGFSRGLWGFFEGEFKQMIEERFSQQGGPSGPWAPLSTKEPPKGGYAARKAKKYGPMPILQADGNLMASFFGGAGYRFTSEPRRMSWGSENPLAGYHQRGHSSPTPLPQRRIFDPDSDFLGRLRSGAVRYVGAAYRQQGFRLIGEVPSETPLRRISRAEASAAGRAYFAAMFGG